MENKDTNTNYQRFFMVGDQKWEIVEIAIKIFFFFSWELYSLFFILFLYCFLYWEFSSPTWKTLPPPRVPIPTQNSDLTPKSLLYKCCKKRLSPPPHPHIPLPLPCGWRMRMQTVNMVFSLPLLSCESSVSRKKTLIEKKKKEKKILRWNKIHLSSLKDFQLLKIVQDLKVYL